MCAPSAVDLRVCVSSKATPTLLPQMSMCAVVVCISLNKKKEKIKRDPFSNPAGCACPNLIELLGKQCGCLCTSRWL